MKLFFITNSKRTEKKKVDELLDGLKFSDFNVLITGNDDKSESYIINRAKEEGLKADIFSRELEGDNIYDMMLNLIDDNDTVILLMSEENETVNKILEEKAKHLTYNIIK